MKNIIEGSDLMIFAQIGTGSTPVSLAFATNCTLSISTETTSVTSKDHGTALWNTSTIKSLSWEATSENLYSDEVNNGYDALFEKMTNREEVTLYFVVKSDTAFSDTTDSWTKGAGGYTGKAFVTSLSATATNGETATFSCTFTGNGELKKAE